MHRQFLYMEMVEEQGMTLDEKAFHSLMEEQRQRARKAREALGDLGWAGVEFGKDVPETEFVGYESNSITGAKVVALVVENEQAEELMPGVEGIVVLDKTPFYAEMGGQVADHGVIAKSGENGCLFTVTDVQKNKGGKYMHYGKVTVTVMNRSWLLISWNRERNTRPCRPCWAAMCTRPDLWWSPTTCALTSPTSPP